MPTKALSQLYLQNSLFLRKYVPRGRGYMNSIGYKNIQIIFRVCVKITGHEMKVADILPFVFD